MKRKHPRLNDKEKTRLYKKWLTTKYTQLELAKKFKITESAVSYILTAFLSKRGINSDNRGYQ